MNNSALGKINVIYKEKRKTFTRRFVCYCFSSAQHFNVHWAGYDKLLDGCYAKWEEKNIVSCEARNYRKTFIFCTNFLPTSLQIGINWDPLSITKANSVIRSLAKERTAQDLGHIHFIIHFVESVQLLNTRKKKNLTCENVIKIAKWNKYDLFWQYLIYLAWARQQKPEYWGHSWRRKFFAKAAVERK